MLKSDPYVVERLRRAATKINDARQIVRVMGEAPGTPTQHHDFDRLQGDIDRLLAAAVEDIACVLGEQARTVSPVDREIPLSR